MNIFEKAVLTIDMFQRKHKPLAATYAVIKKYGDDQAGYQAALVTYYGFLSLFPLLLLLTTVASILSRSNPALSQHLIASATSYFPVIGHSLEQSVHPDVRSGLGLAVGLLLSFYGARGVANAFRNAINNIWHVPLARRAGFPRNMLRNSGIIMGGGLGFILASAVSGWAAAVGRGPWFGVASVILDGVILYGTFIVIFRLSLPLRIEVHRFKIAALLSAIGLAILQLVGARILANVTPSSYSALFATTLGLLAWIYLQAQVIMYAAEVATVRDAKLWPRSLSGKELTAADMVINKRREH